MRSAGRTTNLRSGPRLHTATRTRLPGGGRNAKSSGTWPDPAHSGTRARRAARPLGVLDRRRLRLLREAPAAGCDRRGSARGRTGPACHRHGDPDRQGLCGREHAVQSGHVQLHVHAQVHRHCHRRDGLQRRGEPELPLRHRHREHQHVVRRAVRLQALRRLGARERVQPVLVDAGGHRRRPRPHGLHVRQQGLRHQLLLRISTTPRTACRP